MYLFQILAPVGRHSNPTKLAQINRELTGKFGGVTAYTQNPAKGFWEKNQRQVVTDSVVMIEVMADSVDRKWWNKYQRTLEKRFKQSEIVIRYSKISKI